MSNLRLPICLYFRDRRTVETYIALFVYVSEIEGLSNLRLPCLFIFQISKDCETLHCLVCLYLRDRRTVETYIDLFDYILEIEVLSNLRLPC